MKKRHLPIFGLLITIVFISCEKSEEVDDSWKIANEAAFAKIANNTSAYSRINSATNAGYIMYKEIESGDGPIPYFTDQVKVLYTGWFKYDWNKPDTYTNEKGLKVINKIIFDSTEKRNNIPSKLYVNPTKSNFMTDGFSTALQYMQVGDKWEIWVPWKLGYGTVEYLSGIKPYTTLVFEIELISIVN